MSIQEIIYDWEDRAGFDSPPIPALQPMDINRFRLSLIEEEVEELETAILTGDIVEVADALADIAWVVYGAARAFGIDLDEIIEEVARSNNTKLVDGPQTGDSPKIQKGPHYEPPEIEEKLMEQTRRAES